MQTDICKLCPRQCGVDRLLTLGVCGESAKVRLARAALHFWEEPPISGQSGSGTVFFSGCPLQCVYCQNKSIARGDIGKDVSIERLAQIFLEQQMRGALNINLVTPTHFIPQIKHALDLARSIHFTDNPLTLPVVYNTSGYETADCIRSLKGYVDIFLTDFKYASTELGAKYSSAPDYPKTASWALDEMFELVGPVIYEQVSSSEERMLKGVIVRHMLLPGQLEDSKNVMRILANKSYCNELIVSIMNQYTPPRDIASEYPELNTTVPKDEYEELIDFSLELGIKNSFMQEAGTAKESFIPAFDYEGI